MDWMERTPYHQCLPKDIQFFPTVTPTKLQSIMWLKGVHSPEALHHWVATHTAWCTKEGPNEGTIINHLWTVQYHLGLVCTLCMDFFATSADTMREHVPSCKAIATKDRDGQRQRYLRTTMVMRTMHTFFRRSNFRDCSSHTLCQPLHSLSTYPPQCPKPLNSIIIQYIHTFLLLFVFTTCCNCTYFCSKIIKVR